jgi:hypothetical protein
MNTIERDGREPKLSPNSPTLPSPVIAPNMEDAEEAADAGPATGNVIVASSAEANANDDTAGWNLPELCDTLVDVLKNRRCTSL